MFTIPKKFSDRRQNQLNKSPPIYYVSFTRQVVWNRFSILLAERKKKHFFSNKRKNHLISLFSFYVSVFRLLCGMTTTTPQNMHIYNIATSQLMVTSLHNLETELSINIFNIALRLIAHQLDDFFIDSMIMNTKFSTGGASQFDFDMNRNLFALFGQYARRPDLLFKK